MSSVKGDEVGFLKQLLGRASESKGPYRPSQEEMEAVWEGTPFLEQLPFAQVTSQGKDKTYLVAVAAEHFDMARYARSQGNTDAVIRALCLSLAYSLIAADYESASTALGNLALTYEQKRDFEVALRLQKYALALKQSFVPTREGIARSHWLIGRAQAALGKYTEAAQSMERSLSIFLNPRVAQQLSWIKNRLSNNQHEGQLPPDE